MSLMINGTGYSAKKRSRKAEKADVAKASFVKVLVGAHVPSIDLSH